MPGTITRGREAIQEAAEAAGRGGSFRPFLPSIYWKEDHEEHYVLILTEVDDIPRFEMIRYIKDENGFMQETASKTDEFFGEKEDAFIEEWKGRVQKTNVCIAVELVPNYVVKDGRKKPNGFEVATTDYVRRLVDEEGELTGEEEDVTAPVIGYIAQSPSTFFKHVENYDASEAPITKTAVKITRLGTDQNTAYSLQGYDDQEIDLSNLFEYIEGIGYIKEEIDDVVEGLDGIDDDFEAAAFLATVLLRKREEELLDDDRYQELLEGMTEPFKQFGKGDKKSSRKGATKGTSKRSSRTSQRRAKRDEQPDEDDGDAEPEVEPEAEEKPAKRTRKTGATTRTGKAKAEKAAAKTTSRKGGSETREEALAKLRAKAEARKAA